MSIRKRGWKTAAGEAREGWVVDYVDGQGVRRLKSFGRKKEAEAFRAKTAVEVAEGVHVADSASITIKEAGRLWQATGEAAKLERTTLDQRRQHLKLHIEPLIGDVLLSKLTVPRVRQFVDQLNEQGRSPAMCRKVLTSLGSLIGDAQERGLARTNAVRDLSGARGKGRGAAQARQKRRLEIGRDIPAPDEVRAFLGVLHGRWKPLFMTAVFCGLRASELRGLRWADVDFAKAELRVTQRVDEFGKVDVPKSAAGQRTIPMPPPLVVVLKEWRLACPKGELGLCFPNGLGNVETLSNIRRRGQEPAMVKAGVRLPTGKTDRKGRPTYRAKYPGAHALRHFFASWCVNPVAAGGRGLNAKQVQTLLGHATITLTLDRYAHLFPTSDDGSELAAAASALLG